MTIQTISRKTITVASVLVLALASVASMPFVHADPPATYGAPDQSQCNDSESIGRSWEGEGIDDRPIVTSLSVDGEEVPNPEVAAEAHDIAASICPGTELGRRTGLFIYQKIDGFNNSFDLTTAKTPETDMAFTEDTEITITVAAGDFGELAEFYTFALIHGDVVNYETDDLGTANASLTVTLKPVRTPFGNGEDFGFCTATPPNCNANKSDVDAFAASLDMTFDQDGYGSDFAGSYFAMVGAMGAWVEPVGPGGQPRSLRATLGGPHFLANGSTPNTGSLHAFLPNDAVEALFETTSEDLVESDSLVVERTDAVDNNDTVDVSLAGSDGIMVSIDNFHFSSPVYNIGLSGFGGGDNGGGGEESDNSKSLELPGGVEANLQTPHGTVITSFSGSTEASLAAQDAGYSYPLGLANFSFNVPNGSTQRIYLAYLTNLKPSQVVVRKYNATTKTFATITSATVEEDQMDGHHLLMVSYELTDNGNLDQDTVLGTITDPVGLGVVAAGAPNTGFARR